MARRLTVDPTATWQMYTNTIPEHAEAIGTITRPNGETGALVRMASGLYVQVNDGVIRSLDGRAVASALRTQPQRLPLSLFLQKSLGLTSFSC